MMDKQLARNIFSCALLFSSFILSGCATTQPVISEVETGNKNILADNILKIKKGESTPADIREIFGEPDSIVQNQTTNTSHWTYNYTVSRQKSTDRTPFQVDQISLEIVFNQKDIVIEYIHTVSNKLRKYEQ